MKGFRIVVLAAGAAGVLGMGLLLTAMWLEHNSPLELPTPTGPFFVGRVSQAWMDTSRVDPFSPASAQKRELLVWIWYPTRIEQRAAPYLPDRWRDPLAGNRGVLLTHFLWRNPSEIHGHSLAPTNLAPDSVTYPVIIFRSGIGANA